MSGNNKKYKKAQAALKSQPARAQQQPKPELAAQQSNLKLILVVAVAVLTFICYNYTLKNQFTNWDDGLYVATNPYIKNLTPDNIKMILFHNITNNYYHPITMLTIAANYHNSKMTPGIYYLTNVVMHVLNTILMFFLVYVLLEAMEGKGYGKIKHKEWLAVFGAALYGLHPMHVESVSWLAERKDVMYAFFYFIGLIVYIGYLRGEKIKWYDVLGLVVLLVVSFVAMWGFSEIKYNLTLLGTVVVVGFGVWYFYKSLGEEKNIWVVFVLVFPLYLCSLLSKPLAVVFPFSLFALDVLLKRKADLKLFLEKVPFFLVSFGAGIWAWHAQKASGSVASFHTFSLWERSIFASYGFIMYIVKAFVPIHLCSYYPYPLLGDSNSLPWVYNLLPVVAAALAGVPVYLGIRSGENYLRVVIFGLGFYLFNVLFVLQFVSSGPAIMADRYTYIAYFGIFFMVVYFGQQLWEKMPPYRTVLKFAGGAFVCILAYLCFERTQVWHNTKTLWLDVISKYPASADTTWNATHTAKIVKVQQGVPTAYKNLGNYYVQDKNPPDYDSAYMYYKVLEDIHSDDAGVYSNLGNIWAIRHNINKALEEYTKSIRLDSNDFDVYLDRAVTYSNLGQFDLAIEDYNHAARIDPNSEGLLSNRGYTYLSAKQYQKCIDDYNRLIKINPDNPQYYFNRGVAESDIGNPQAALADFMKDLSANPKNANCLFNISVVYQQMKDYKNALDYAVRAQQAGYKVADSYIKSLQDKAK